jgi:hypothetical protein
MVDNSVYVNDGGKTMSLEDYRQEKKWIDGACDELTVMLPTIQPILDKLKTLSPDDKKAYRLSCNSTLQPYTKLRKEYTARKMAHDSFSLQREGISLSPQPT